ncbi:MULTISPECIES: LysR family transcriptional regulator [unclassified Salipiger]|uniref:LysR family transcriptional regulator n=1 Tax=unclassified Salipiger TaxID=2640570 RepID=UPI00080AAACB|nr:MULTISPECIES: LysR family transcriptional regulator [unclassified Salipiger]ANT60838.1 transcriptional regulator [Salipiger sp. CCB-MM3]NDW01544.1 LysR family transcriptional regulator [Salipiger sp. PrR002]NDW58221.1 LysR family transcriptional regulator [Salipiger sp. PrR004]
MNFKQLEAFYWLSEFHNYRQTAEHLGLTQPAVSARIQSLEKDLGKTLIDREAPGFVLTDQGLEVAEFAVDFLNLREAMMGRLQDKQKRGLSIGLAGMAALTWGPLLRAAVEAAHPELILDIYAGSDLQLRRFVEAGTLDAAFTATGDRARGTDFAVRYDVGWVARPDVIEGRAMPMSPDELRKLPLVLYPKTSPLFTPVADYVDDMRERPAPRHYGNSLSTICEMVRGGYGASALALTALREDLARGTVVHIPATEPLAPLHVSCTHLNRARRKQVVEVLELAREAAREWCAEHPEYSSFVEI